MPSQVPALTLCAPSVALQPSDRYNIRAQLPGKQKNHVVSFFSFELTIMEVQQALAIRLCFGVGKMLQDSADQRRIAASAEISNSEGIQLENM